MRSPLLSFLLLSLFLLNASLGWAQNAPLVGRIIDAKTQKPVPYASVRLREQESLSGKAGRFVLQVPDRADHDSLIITSLEYQRKALAWQKGSRDSAVLELTRLNPLFEFYSIVCRSVKKITLGANTKNPGAGMIQGMPGSQYAFMVKNEKGKKLGYIRSVSFYIGENGTPREAFRVRLYKANGLANAPGADLLKESMMVAAPAGGQWFTVDLTSYSVPAPQEGFYVAMEWVSDYPFSNFDGSYTPYGQVLRPTFEFEESRTWNYTLGRGWSLITLAKGKNRYNAMMRAEVEVYK